MIEEKDKLQNLLPFSPGTEKHGIFAKGRDPELPIHIIAAISKSSRERIAAYSIHTADIKLFGNRQFIERILT
jgi:hypothetical protein